MRKTARLREISTANQTLLESVTRLTASVGALGERVGAVSQRLEDVAQATATHDMRLQTAMQVLQMIHDDEAANRRAVHELRRSPDYELAFTEPDPLISVVIPTYANAGMLRERSIPSALDQTHPNLEVIVVGDASPPEVEEAVTSFSDERVRFHNLSIRGPYPADKRQAWLVSGTPPYNLGVSLARGRWIAPLGDDDAFTPDHVERLLARAREDRLELVYGLLRRLHPDGTHGLIGVFPPEFGQFGLQASLLHAGLGFMQMHLTDVLFELPNDFALCRRMLRAGVRMGMLDAVVGDYYPSLLWGGREALESPTPDAPAPDEPTSTDVRAPDELLEDLRQYVNSLEAQLAAVRASRSWRWTSAMRRAVGRFRSS